MSSVQHLREFIRERLTAAAEEIFTEVEKTIISYEEELDVQRRMMGISWKPDIKLHRVGSELQRQSSDLQQIQQICSLASRSNQDQKEAEHQWTGEELMELEPKWIKEEEEEEPEPTLLKHEKIDHLLKNVIKEELDSSVLQHEQQSPEHFPTGQDQKDLCSSEEGEEQTVQEQFAALIEISTLQENDMNEAETRTEQLSFSISPLVESKDQEGSSSSISESQSDTSTKKRSLKCDICGRCYTQQWKLRNHYRTHTGERPFSCETCEKNFSLMNVLNRHKKIHTGEKPFSCHTCGKSFSRISNLNVHKKIHTCEKPFSCESCGKTFSQISYLNHHRRIYAGEMRFACQTCGERFSQICDLNCHKKIHTAERPFSCKSCEKRFSRMKALNHHKKIHSDERPFLCKSCGKRFLRIGDLNRHKKIHTGEKPFSCESCGKSFSRRDNLRIHMKTHAGHMF